MEKYRARKPAPKYKPETMADFIDVLRRTPKDILNDTDRAKIAAVMTFNEQKVKDLAHPKSEMVTVGAKELLGPLTIDRLYQSGFTKFPVINEKEQVFVKRCVDDLAFKAYDNLRSRSRQHTTW